MAAFRASHSRPDRRLAAFLAVAGVPIGIFVLLFAVANDTWVAIHIPGVPWSAETSFAAFEARLWGIMLACLLAGALLAGFLLRLIGSERRRKDATVMRRIRELETELENVNRLLAATQRKS